MDGLELLVQQRPGRTAATAVMMTVMVMVTVVVVVAVVVMATAMMAAASRQKRGCKQRLQASRDKRIPKTRVAGTPSPRAFTFSVENAACKDSYRRQCRRSRFLRSLPTLTSVRILTDSALQR